MVFVFIVIVQIVLVDLFKLILPGFCRAFPIYITFCHLANSTISLLVCKRTLRLAQITIALFHFIPELGNRSVEKGCDNPRISCRFDRNRSWRGI